MLTFLLNARTTIILVEDVFAILDMAGVPLPRLAFTFRRASSFMIIAVIILHSSQELHGVLQKINALQFLPNARIIMTIAAFVLARIRIKVGVRQADHASMSQSVAL